MKTDIYLDHAATTPPYPQVVDLMHDVANIGNASSLHRCGRAAKEQLETARRQIAELLELEEGFDPASIVFTSGATEANNLAVFGTTRSMGGDPKHLITSEIEHPSVLEAIRQLEREGWAVSYLPCSNSGIIDPEQFARAIRPDTVFASIMLVNNETGMIQPVKAMAEMARRNNVIFHCDAVQAVGKIEFQPDRLGVDLMTISGHKIAGPRGIGLLIRSKPRGMLPTLWGGGQEQGLRPGTENGPAILGLALAMRITLREQAKNVARLVELKQHLLRELQTKIPPLVQIGSTRSQDAVPHILCVAIPEVIAEILLARVDVQGLAIASGSACRSGKLGISPVLQAMKLDPELARGMLRFSISATQSTEQISAAADIVRQSWVSRG